jgi:Raf kinase inhibitor-like YbhB/YbcL family protein
MDEFTLSSSAFGLGEPIPARYSCEGEDLSPPLAWSGVPAEARSLALIVDDPDAPHDVFTHWVVFDLPAGARALPEGVAKAERLDSGGVQGRNDFGSLGYRGPCPPRGAPHHYRFTLYALNATVNLRPGASKQDLVEAIRDRILAKAELIGIYRRAG